MGLVVLMVLFQAVAGINLTAGGLPLSYVLCQYEAGEHLRSVKVKVFILFQLYLLFFLCFFAFQNIFQFISFLSKVILDLVFYGFLVE